MVISACSLLCNCVGSAVFVPEEKRLVTLEARDMALPLLLRFVSQGPVPGLSTVKDASSWSAVSVGVVEVAVRGGSGCHSF